MELCLQQAVEHACWHGGRDRGRDAGREVDIKKDRDAGRPESGFAAGGPGFKEAQVDGRRFPVFRVFMEIVDLVEPGVIHVQVRVIERIVRPIIFTLNAVQKSSFMADAFAAA